jgi:hypothetical protein
MRKIILALILIGLWCLPAHGQMLMQMGKAPAAGGGTPTWSAEIATARLTETSDVATSAIAVGAVAQNMRVVVAVYWYSAAGQTLDSVSDSRSNSYTIHVTESADTPNYLAIASANTTTALQAGDSITLHWGTPGFTYRAGSAFSFSNCNTTTQPDGTPVNVSSYGSSLSASGTVANNTVQLGVAQVSTQTYTSPATGWSIIGAVHTTGNSLNLYYYRGTFATGGSKSPAGTIGSADSYDTVWVSFK